MFSYIQKTLYKGYFEMSIQLNQLIKAEEELFDISLHPSLKTEISDESLAVILRVVQEKIQDVINEERCNDV